MSDMEGPSRTGISCEGQERARAGNE